MNHLDVNKKTALMLTADKKGKKEDSYALVQLLIKKGAIVNIQGNEGNTAMMLFATMTGWISSTSSSTTLPWKLTRQGHDKKGKKEDSYALVQLLSKKGAIVNIQRNEGNTAMMLFATMTGWIFSTSSSTTLPWKLTWQGPI